MEKQYNDVQKHAALEHVRYEISQLAWLYHARSLPLGQLLGNAVVETTVIHLHILIQLFQESERKGKWDDVLAVDYAFPASQLNIDLSITERRNKEVAHLTYTRSKLSPQERGWVFDNLVPPVLRRAQQFAEHLLAGRFPIDDQERAEWEKVLELTSGMPCLPIRAAIASTAHVQIADIRFGPQSVNPVR